LVDKFDFYIYLINYMSKTLRILFITDNFPPEVNAPATRTYEHCKAWAEKGVRVTIITCAPNFPHGQIYDGYKNRFFQKEKISGIRVIRVWSYITSNNGFVKRILDYMSFAWMAFAVGLFQKHDVIVATSPQFFTTWAAWGISKIRGKPWIFELRDLWPESIKTVGAMKQGRIINTLERIAYGLYRDADKVVAVTEAFKTKLVQEGIDAQKIEVVTNGSNLELFSTRPKNKELLQNLGLEDKFVIGYIGTHGMAHSLDFIVRSIASINDTSIHFLFIGDGAMKQTVVELAAILEIKNITFIDQISKEEVPLYLSVIDVSLVPLLKQDNFKSVIPSKIFEAASMKKPILLGVEGEAQRIIQKYAAGLCFEPENEEDFLEKLLQIRDIEHYKKLQHGCEKLAQDFERKNLAAKMLKIVQKIAGVDDNKLKKNEGAVKQANL
jgi:glycosyltransferase involved in cell wall biosynthesis